MAIKENIESILSKYGLCYTLSNHFDDLVDALDVMFTKHVQQLEYSFEQVLKAGYLEAAREIDTLRERCKPNEAAVAESNLEFDIAHEELVNATRNSSSGSTEQSSM